MEIQYVPGIRTIGGVEMTKSPALGPGVAVRLPNPLTSDPGTPPESLKIKMFTALAGPLPLKYSPSTSTWVIVHVEPVGTTKSSAAKLSKAFHANSKSCELIHSTPAL